MMRGAAKKHDTPATHAADALEEARAMLSRWEAEKAAAEAELASLQDRAGAEVLDDPDAAARLPRVMAELRDRIDIAGRAMTAQLPRVTAAESAYLAAEADVLEAPVTAARAALERHNERTAALLKQLEEHEGPYVPKEHLDFELARNQVGQRTIELTKSEVLETQVKDLELPALILREMAAGNDPSQMVAQWGRKPEDVYPGCVWGPNALVPAPAYRSTMTNRRANLATVEQSIAQLETTVARLKVEADAESRDPVLGRPGMDPTTTARYSLGHTERALELARGQARELRQRLGLDASSTVDA